MEGRMLLRESRFQRRNRRDMPVAHLGRQRPQRDIQLVNFGFGDR